MKHPFLVTRTCINSARTREEKAVYRNTSLSLSSPPLFLSLFYFFYCTNRGLDRKRKLFGIHRFGNDKDG